MMPISGKPEIGATLLKTNTDLILRSAPKARVSKDGPRAHMRPSFETARTQVGCSRLAHHNADLG